MNQPTISPSDAARILRAHQRTITTTCAVCGREFTARNYPAEVRTCSATCRSALRHQRRRAREQEQGEQS